MQFPLELIHIIAKYYQKYKNIKILFKLFGYKIDARYAIKYFSYPTIVNREGTKKYKNLGLKHRIKKPAVRISDEDIVIKEWWLYGKKHRINGPAVIIEHEEGTIEKQWWYNGMKHRENDLPAIIRSNGAQYWWLNNKLIRSENV